MANKMIERLQEGPKPGTTIFRALNSINLSFRFDDESGGIYAIDQGGFLLTREELKDLNEGVLAFLGFHGDDAVEEHNATIQNESKQQYGDETVRTPSRKGWIYVVEGQGDLYKIGLTTRTPSKRLAEFTPKLPFPTTLLVTIPTDDVISHEKAIHERFADRRVNGEWFKLSDRDILWLRAGAR
jgi:hypothetical protein